MSPMDAGLQRMNDRLVLAAHEPATWLWLAASIAAIAVYWVAAWRLSPWDELDGWLGLAAFGCVFWILFGWMGELFAFDAHGHVSFILGWEYPVLFAFVLASIDRQ